MVCGKTYQTNKFVVICVPFVGMNQHSKSVMFGYEFVTDEKIDLIFGC